jgi:hypothetical protein
MSPGRPKRKRQKKCEPAVFKGFRASEKYAEFLHLLKEGAGWYNFLTRMDG